MFWNTVPIQIVLYQVHRETCIIGHVFLNAYGGPQDLQHYQTDSNIYYNFPFLLEVHSFQQVSNVLLTI